MKFIINTVAILFAFSLNAQVATNKFKELKVNEKIPDVILNDLNDSTAHVPLSKFKGKYILLDFWSVHCSACIAGFPKLNSLQKQFRANLQIVLINNIEERRQIKKFFTRWEKATNNKVSSLIVNTLGDTLLNRLFPHDGVPLYVLIDNEGYVKAFPAVDQLSPNDVNSILNGKSVEMNKKPFKIINVDGYKPLFVNGNAGIGEGILSYSLLSKKVEGLPTSLSFICDSSGCKVYDFNDNIRGLFQLAFYDGFKSNEDFINVAAPYMRAMTLLNNRTELNVKDTTKYVDRINGKYNQENRYTYQLLSSKSNYKTFQQKMQSDLQTYFGLKAEYKKVLKKCLVFTSSDTSFCHATGNEKRFSNYNPVGVNYVNTPFSIIMYDLTYSAYYTSPYPLIDETGIMGNVNITFDANVKDWKSLSEAFKKYKIDVKLEDKPVEVLVISEFPN